MHGPHNSQDRSCLSFHACLLITEITDCKFIMYFFELIPIILFWYIKVYFLSLFFCLFQVFILCIWQSQVLKVVFLFEHVNLFPHVLFLGIKYIKSLVIVFLVQFNWLTCLSSKSSRKKKDFFFFLLEDTLLHLSSSEVHLARPTTFTFRMQHIWEN